MALWPGYTCFFHLLMLSVLEEGIIVMSSAQSKSIMLQVKQPQKETSRGLNGWQVFTGGLWCVRTDLMQPLHQTVCMLCFNVTLELHEAYFFQASPYCRAPATSAVTDMNWNDILTRDVSEWLWYQCHFLVWWSLPISGGVYLNRKLSALCTNHIWPNIESLNEKSIHSSFKPSVLPVQNIYVSVFKGVCFLLELKTWPWPAYKMISFPYN